MNKLSILPIAIVGLGIMTLPAPAHAIVEFDQNVTPDVIMGTGIGNGGFTTDRRNGLELGLRTKQRFPAANIFNSNGDGTYSWPAVLAAAPNKAEWSFEWTVNIDELAPAGNGLDLDDFSYELGIDTDPSLATSYTTVFDPIHAFNPGQADGHWDHSIGDNTTLNGGGAEASDIATYNALKAANNVAQQSWQAHWFFVPFDPTVAGTYSIYLEAWDGANLVARTEIQILTGNAHPVLPPVVNPVSYDMPNGGTGTYEYHDETYSGLGDNTVDCAALTDGLGDLTDDFIANTDLLNQATSDPYVGWRNNVAACTNPTITFNFAAATAFSSVTVYAFDRNGRGGVGVPTSASVEVIGNAVRNFPLVDPAGEGQVAYTLDLSGDTGDEVAITLNHSTQWLFISEVVFSGDVLPGANDDIATVTEDDPATAIDVLANDYNADGGPMSIDSVTQPANGTVVNNGSDLTYEPNENFCSLETVVEFDDPVLASLTPLDGTSHFDAFGISFEDETFYAVDSDCIGAGTDEYCVTTTTGSNNKLTVVFDEAPIHVVAFWVTISSLEITGTAYDANGNVIDVQSQMTAGGITHGAFEFYGVGPISKVTFNDGTGQIGIGRLEFTNYSDTFTYTLTPGGSTANVAVSVECVNDAPVAVENNYTIPEDSLTSLTGNVIADNTGEGVDYDVDGDAMMLAATSSTTHGVITFDADDLGGFSYVPFDDYCGPDEFNYFITEVAPAAQGPTLPSNTVTVSITVTCVNDPPVAVDDPSPSTDYAATEDILLTINVAAGVLANDSDVDGDTLIVKAGSVIGPTYGTLILASNGSFTYDPNDDYCGSDSFTYKATDGPTPITGPPMDSGDATASIAVACVNDPPVVSVSPAAQTADYSDFIGTVTITATDVDDILLTLGQTGAPSNLPDPALGTTRSCNTVSNDSIVDGSSCTWTMKGQVLVPGLNVHNINFTASDDEPSSSADNFPTTRHVLTVHAEDATVVLDDGNEVSIEVDAPDGDSPPFSLTFTAWETNNSGLPYVDGADFPHTGTPADGDFTKARAYMSLVPVGSGGPVTADCNPPDSSGGAGYGEWATFVCDFDEVPVNTYEVVAQIDGESDTTAYYYGKDEDVFVVYDPSLGFTTAGGWFYWPGTAQDNDQLPCYGYPGDKTNFGYTMKYNKKATKVQGSAIVMQHTIDPVTCLDAGNYRVKSNALYGLAIGEITGPPTGGWAAFAGKATFRMPNGENEGNHTFLIYAEDFGEQGCGQDPSDMFWVEVKDKDDVIVMQVNGPNPAGNGGGIADAEAIQCGNIYVPHKTGSKGGGGNPHN